MMKEIAVKFSMAYDDKDFKEVVADFVAGEWISYHVISDVLTIMDADQVQASFRAPRR